MANIALVTDSTGAVVESIQQHTAPVIEEIPPRSPVRIDGATGKFTLANGTTATEADLYGISTNTITIRAGMTVTAIRRGVLDGFDLSAKNYGAAIFLSDTDGRLGDAAGTVSVKVGRVIPVFATTFGNSPDKVLSVEL
jgi:hypothetical protein